MPKILKLNSNESEIASVCADLLKISGSVLLLPTDTVYGLVCRWDDMAAIAKIREMKGRDGSKPFQMLAPNIESAVAAGVELTALVKCLADAFCPGPLTIVARSRRSDDFNRTDVAPQRAIGFRIPDNSLLAALMLAANANLAATSANPSGAPPMRTLSNVEKIFTPPPDLVIDAGALPQLASTVVDVSDEMPIVLRPGAVTEMMIAEVVGEPVG